MGKRVSHDRESQWRLCPNPECVCVGLLLEYHTIYHQVLNEQLASA